jgi:ribosomal protein S18 acetylase RimI-like enzyme
MTIEVRPARLADAPGIARVHVSAWQEAYSHLVPAEDLAKQSVDQRTLRWAEIIRDGVTDVFVATDETGIVGWASASAGRGDMPPRDRELEGIYLLAGSYGSGAGQALLDAAIGDAAAFLWVAEDNPRAQAFYARNGFRPDGAEETHPLAGTPVKAVRLVR